VCVCVCLSVRLDRSHQFLDVLLHRHLVCSFIVSQRDSISCPFLSPWGRQEQKSDISANLQNDFPTQSPGQYRVPTFFSLSCARHSCKEHSNYVKLSGRYNYLVCPNTLCE